jgi:hypothetical protein
VFDLGWDISYPDLGFTWFSPVPLVECRDYTLIRPQQLHSKSFPILLSLIHPVADDSVVKRPLK